MESSPLFQLGRGERAQQDSSDEWDEYLDNECGLHEVALVETEMAALRPIRTIASPVKRSQRRKLLFADSDDDVPLCSLSPFLDEDCCNGTDKTSRGIQRRGGWWRGRTAKSATLGLAVCLVLAAVMMGWFSSYQGSDNDNSGEWAHPEARALADPFDDDFRITFPDGSVPFYNRVSAALGSLLGGEDAVREGGLRNMAKDIP